MYAAKHKASKKGTLLHKKFPKAKLRRAKSTHLSLNGTIKPIKKMNKQIILYVTKKPYQSMTIATVVSGLVLGWAYMKLRNFWW